MANDFIQIIRSDSTMTEAQSLLSAINQLRAGVNAVKDCFAKMQHMDNGGDLSRLHDVFGVPTGSETTVFQAIDGTISALNSTDYPKNLLTRIG